MEKVNYAGDWYDDRENAISYRVAKKFPLIFKERPAKMSYKEYKALRKARNLMLKIRLKQGYRAYLSKKLRFRGTEIVDLGKGTFRKVDYQ